jgi:hypothetical protein
MRSAPPSYFDSADHLLGALHLQLYHVVFDASPRRCREARAGLVQILGNDEMVVVPVLYWTSQTASPYLGTTMVYTSELPPTTNKQ